MGRWFCAAARASRRSGTSGQPTAISFPPRRAGSFPASGWRPKRRSAASKVRDHDSAVSFPCRPLQIRRTVAAAVREGPDSRPKRLPAWLFYDEAGSRAVRADHRTARVLPDAHGARHLCAHAGEMVRSGSRWRTAAHRGAGRWIGGKDAAAVARRREAAEGTGSL